MLDSANPAPGASPVIALDAMGGDVGAAVVIAGAELARARYPDLRFRIYGRESDIRPALAQAPRVAAEAEIVAVDGVVLGSDKPSQAIRRAHSTSMGRAVEAVKRGEAAAAVSAGNTGALMAMAKLGLRTMAGIDRPALVALMPTMTGSSVVLDLGANTDCDAENLVQFAVMGAAFARTVLGVADTAAIMVGGRIVAAGPPEAIEADFASAYLGALT